MWASEFIPKETYRIQIHPKLRNHAAVSFVIKSIHWICVNLYNEMPKICNLFNKKRCFFDKKKHIHLFNASRKLSYFKQKNLILNQ